MSNTPDTTGINAAFIMAEAIQDSVESVSNQQKVDVNTTVAFGELEMKLNSYWYGADNGHGIYSGCPLQNYVDAINNLVNKYDPNVPGSGEVIKNMLTGYNAQYRAACAEASNATNYADSRMQQSNSQVRTDSTNITTLCQIGQTMNIMNFILKLTSK